MRGSSVLQAGCCRGATASRSGLRHRHHRHNKAQHRPTFLSRPFIAFATFSLHPWLASLLFSRLLAPGQFLNIAPFPFPPAFPLQLLLGGSSVSLPSHPAEPKPSSIPSPHQPQVICTGLNPVSRLCRPLNRYPPFRPLLVSPTLHLNFHPFATPNLHGSMHLIDPMQ
ncbi:hypothetical protein FA13DRAFT_1414504 [Coprinellus micaceus]|uniref:Uncharacterized protein n=1 Tax=Coprinellus micaceus TaxID=71717 RepID=A0A4Y7SNM0_COPMI|nr:hypothetical protein FA13DRAFT_1414504 [Coprinellus micaceus]